MTVIGTCGHELTPWPENERSVVTKNYSRECRRVVSYRTVCPECEQQYENWGILLHNQQEIDEWMSGKDINDPFVVDDEDDFEDEDIEIYCPKCKACGEDGCCPPWKCKHEKGCLYPEYSNNLYVKFRRILYRLEMKIKLHLWRRSIK